MAANNLQINVNVGGNATVQAVQSRIKKTDALLNSLPEDIQYSVAVINY